MEREATARERGPELAPIQDDALVRLLVESIRDYAIYMLDPEGRIVTWNSGAEHIKGYPAKEVIGKHFSLFYERRDIAQGRPDWELEMARTRSRFEGEGWRVRKDGTRFWASIVIAAMREPGGRLLGYAKVTRDLTERRKVEEAAQQLLEEKEVRKRAEAAVAIRDDFIAVAGHELKTPLSSLLLELQSTLRTVRKDPSTKRVADRIERAVSSATHLGKLIDQLLDVSRITAGRLRLEPEPFNLTDLVRDAIARIQELATHTQTPVSLDAEPVIEGVWDRARLEQVIVNLISNALKYGRGHPVEVRLASTPQFVEIRVADHGIGIQPEQQGRIFERYERAVEDKDYGGFGLGLWISKQIVTLSGGRIEVSSEAGKGATFIVGLPRRTPDSTGVEGDGSHD